MSIKFGKQGGRRGGILQSLVRKLRTLLSAVAITLSIFMFLISLSQILIHAMSVQVFNEDNFQNWWSAPLLPFIFSIVFLILFLLLNYERVPILKDIAPKLKGVRAPKTPKDIELPEFD